MGRANKQRRTDRDRRLGDVMQDNVLGNNYSIESFVDELGAVLSQTGSA
jgi:hypothetical protein